MPIDSGHTIRKMCMAALWLLACAACSESEPRSAPMKPEAAVPAVAEQSASYRLQRVSAWPGGGLQLWAAPVISLTTRTSAEPRLYRDDAELDAPSSLGTAAAGISAVLVAPAADAALHAGRLEAAAAIVEALPDGERVGLWLAADRLPLLAELTEKKEHVLERIAAIPAEDLGAVDSEALLSLRVRLGPLEPTLFNVGPALPEAEHARDLNELQIERPDAAGSWELHAIADTDRQIEPELDRAVRQLVAAQAQARAGVTRIAACGGFEAGEKLTLELGEQKLAVTAPPASELSEHTCDASEAAADVYPLATSISLELTPEELTLHDRNAAENGKGDYTLHVKLPDSPAIFATAHFRGQTSLKCERKSYSVKLEDKRRRRLFAGASVSEFYLLSLCTEQGWFRQVLANRLMRELGLFPMEQRYVHLQVAGRERGLYLLLEKPEEKLRDTQLALTTVIRRRDETEGTDAEIEYPGSRQAQKLALEQYFAVDALVENTEPDQLYAALAQKIDMATYLRWLALQTTFQSGDYIDEVFFYASDESAAADGGWYFRNVGWDTDDLFAKCHNRGEAAHIDPHEIVYCAESRLDRALFVSGDVYARFIRALRTLMESTLAPQRVESELERIREELKGMLEDDAVCLATLGELNGQPSTCEILRPWVDAQIDDFVSKVHARHALLQERIAAYEASL
jgi:hypothetical protein